MSNRYVCQLCGATDEFDDPRSAAAAWWYDSDCERDVCPECMAKGVTICNSCDKATTTVGEQPLFDIGWLPIGFGPMCPDCWESFVRGE